MSKHPATSVVAFILGIALIAPSAFLIVPQKVYAQVPVGVPTVEMNPVLVGTEITTTAETTISAVKSTLSWALDVTNTAANYAQKINALYLQPLAFILSGNLMKMLTAGVIGFVIGKANGTGAPQFAVDVMKTMQTVSDGAALAYLKQVSQTNSPFAGSISLALKNNYLTKSSLAGFWAANMCSLSRSSPNVPAYLAGNWSQGGVAAWFALTTQTQNNPYTLYQNSQSQMGSIIGSGAGGVTGVRASQLGWGSGFMSWCGSTDSTAAPAGNNPDEASASVTATQQTISASDATAAQQACLKNGSNATVCQSAYDAMMAGVGSTVAVSPGGGINPGDPCTNKDGTPGTIQTPGSTIKATLDKVLGGQQDQIVRMGNVGPQINQILGNIASVIQTVKFASSLLGGSGSAGGLLGVGQTSAANNRSALTQFMPTQNASGGYTSGYLGATQSSINDAAAASDAAAAAASAAGAADASSATAIAVSNNDIFGRITNFTSAWKTIAVAAQTASTSVSDLASFCDSTAAVNPASAAQATAARAALANEIAPVLAQAAAVAPAMASTTALAQKIQANLNSLTDTTGAIYVADTQMLQSLSPTMSDVVSAQQNTQVYGASASPAGSLTVSGGSLVGQMNLISTNAAALKDSVCAPPVDSGAGVSY